MNNSVLNTIKQFVRQQGSPKELLMNFMQRSNPNPMMSNLLNMAKNGDYKGVENFARNALKEQGRDFDNEFNQFKQFFNR